MINDMEAKQIEFRTLRATEIQVRPTDTKTKGSCTLLLYQDARAFMDILDETVGNTNWQKEYYEVNGNVYCRIGIKFDGEWVWKADAGMEGNIDAAKSEASDAAKRAAVCWGLGRELYSGPRIRIKDLPESYYYNDKLTMAFYVQAIEYVDKKISYLSIADRFGKQVYEWSKDAIGSKKTESIQMSANKKLNSDILREFCSVKKVEQGVDLGELTRFFDFYKDTVDKWQNTVMPEKLWTRWEGTRRTA